MQDLVPEEDKVSSRLLPDCVCNTRRSVGDSFDSSIRHPSRHTRLLLRSVIAAQAASGI